jgi:hypothetical protein
MLLLLPRVTIGNLEVLRSFVKAEWLFDASCGGVWVVGSDVKVCFCLDLVRYDIGL